MAEVPAVRTPILPPDVNPHKIEEVFADNFDVIRFGDLERIGTPSGGGEHWKIDAIDGVRHERVLVGVIVHWNASRSYFTSRQAQHVDCWSPDGKKGIGNPGGNCEICPKSMFIDDKPQECKEQRVVYLLTQEGILPYLLMLPPTSIAPFRKFMVRLGSKQLSYYEVQVELTLKDEKSKDNQVYSVLQIRPLRKLDPDEIRDIRNYRYSLQAHLRRDFSEATTDAEAETVHTDAQPAGEDMNFKEPTDKEIEDYVDRIDEPEDLTDPEDPGNVQYETEKAPPATVTEAPATITAGPATSAPHDPLDVVDPSISNDEFLAGADWSRLVNEKKNDPKVFEIFKVALSTRFYARMSKKNMNKDQAKEWLLRACQLEGAEVSTKDVLSEPDLIRAVNIAYWEEYREVLFIQI